MKRIGAIVANTAAGLTTALVSLFGAGCAATTLVAGLLTVLVVILGIAAMCAVPVLLLSLFL